MAEKKDYGIDFVNIEIKYPLETLMRDDEYPTADELFVWIGQQNRGYVKVSFGWNERSRSYTATGTDSNEVTKGEKPKALTQHGKSPQSAILKLYFLIELCGLGRLNEDTIEMNLGEREDVVSQQLVGLLKK